MSWSRIWYWHTLVRPMPALFGDPKHETFRCFWRGVYGLCIGSVFIGVIRRWPDKTARAFKDEEAGR